MQSPVESIPETRESNGRIPSLFRIVVVARLTTIINYLDRSLRNLNLQRYRNIWFGSGSEIVNFYTSFHVAMNFTDTQNTTQITTEIQLKFLLVNFAFFANRNILLGGQFVGKTSPTPRYLSQFTLQPSTRFFLTRSCGTGCPVFGTRNSQARRLRTPISLVVLIGRDARA